MDVSTSQRILICGTGSIGERHIRNLLALGYSELALYRSRGLPLRTLSEEFKAYTDLGAALNGFRPTIVFVTNPTSLHLPVAIQAAKAGCHLFIEKPVSHTLTGLEELENILRGHGRFGMVGYMLRFHPLMLQVKNWLEEGATGRLGLPIHVRSTWGEHVPDWHPWENYESSYSVLRNLGGGAALTFSHDLDLLVWLFGKASSVVGMPFKHPSLSGDSEQGVDILMRFENGTNANVHLDYFQRPPHRSFEIVGTRGRAVFDYASGTLTHFDGVVGEKPSASGIRQPVVSTTKVPAGYERNEMFLEELRYFFDCLERNIQPRPGIAEAAESVRIANLAVSSQKARDR